MKLVVAGASAAGQFSALLLARAGHQVQLLDRDDLSPAADVDAAAVTAFRPTAPQIVQPHFLLPRCRSLLQQHLPDVYQALLANGAVEAPLSTTAPPGWQFEQEPGDDAFTSLAVRRSTLDLVLRRSVAAQPRLRHRYEVRVDGLLANPGDDDRPPRVRGVRTGEGDVEADLVVDATGRRTQLDAWLAEVGTAATTQEQAECGLAYYSRHYRIRPDALLPGHPATRVLLALDEFTTGLWNGDNGTATIAISPLVQDTRFRPVRNPEVFDAVARTVPAFRPWLDVLEPVSDVFIMGGLHNTYRRLATEGRLVATGLALVGDSRCTTNPTFGRGLPLALLQAADLVEALGLWGDEPLRLAQELESRSTENIHPFYLDQARNDAARLAALRHVVFDEPPPAPPADPESVTLRDLRLAMPQAPDALRAFWRVMGMVDRPVTVYTDPAVVRRTKELLGRSSASPSLPQPETTELMRALTGAARA